MKTLASLEAHLARFPSLLVGFSGGVDSAVVAVAARRALGRTATAAALGVSPSLAAEQHGRAREVAERWDVPFLEIETHELEDDRYAANPTNRCFFCKDHLWDRLSTLARTRGFAAVADGTNADDLQGHRPGKRAGEAHHVVSPLASLGVTKGDVRSIARFLGLPIWNAPSAPCLASRIRYGLPVTSPRLRQVERGEETLRAIGVGGDLRVRHWGDQARIEVEPAHFSTVRSHAPSLVARFRALGFRDVALDLDGYRTGSLLDPNASLESLGTA